MELMNSISSVLVSKDFQCFEGPSNEKKLLKILTILREINIKFSIQSSTRKLFTSHNNGSDTKAYSLITKDAFCVDC